MKTFSIFILSINLLTPLWAIDIKTVTFPSDSETTSARWAIPEGTGPFPAIILVHEWWGFNDWIGHKMEELTREGYAVLAIDLYRGKSTNNPEEAHELMRGLPEDRAMRDLSSAMNYLKQQPTVKPQKIGVIGWCMGGGYALKLATQRPDLTVCVVYYGSLPTNKETLARITCPVIAFFGAEDRGISVQDIKQFEQTMQELGKKVIVRIYERAGHAFMNNTRPTYSKPASIDSWKRCLTFLSNTLKDGSEN